MGIDLKVTASYFREHRGEFLPTAKLRFDRDHGLFAQLAREAKPCLVQPLPVGLKAGYYEDKGLTFREADRHGDPLTFTTPARIRPLRVPDAISPWNGAVRRHLDRRWRRWLPQR